MRARRKARTLSVNHPLEMRSTSVVVFNEGLCKVVEQYARFTGLPTNYVERANLRVSLGRFASELLADENRVIGRYEVEVKIICIPAPRPGAEAEFVESLIDMQIENVVRDRIVEDLFSPPPPQRC